MRGIRGRTARQEAASNPRRRRAVSGPAGRILLENPTQSSQGFVINRTGCRPEEAKGQLFVTNAPIVVNSVVEAQCVVSGGQLAARTIELDGFSGGTLLV